MNSRLLPLALKYCYQILHNSTQCHFELPIWTCVNFFCPFDPIYDQTWALAYLEYSIIWTTTNLTHKLLHNPKGLLCVFISRPLGLLPAFAQANLAEGPILFEVAPECPDDTKRYHFGYLLKCWDTFWKFLVSKKFDTFFDTLWNWPKMYCFGLQISIISRFLLNIFQNFEPLTEFFCIFRLSIPFWYLFSFFWYLLKKISGHSVSMDDLGQSERIE